MIKNGTRVNYLSADWIFIEAEESGFRLKSICKNVEDIVVPFNKKKMIKLAEYQSSTRLIYS